MFFGVSFLFSHFADLISFRARKREEVREVHVVKIYFDAEINYLYFSCDEFYSYDMQAYDAGKNYCLMPESTDDLEKVQFLAGQIQFCRIMRITLILKTASPL